MASASKNGTLELSQVVYYKAEQANQLPVPTFSPAGGASESSPASIDKGDDITIEMPADGEVLHYTVNGTVATATADAVISTSNYAHGDVIALTEVYATADGMTDSNETAAYYVVNDPDHEYSVNVASDIVNGTVSVSPTSAAAGATVTVTATPAEGYALNKITVLDGNNNSVTVENNQFTMPASDVTVSATFKVSLGDPKEVFDFVGWEFGTYGWSSSYSEHSVAGTIGTVTFAAASKQTGTITDCPVTKGSDIDVVLNDANSYKIIGAQIVLRQWTTKAQTVKLNVSSDGEEFELTGDESGDFELTVTGLDAKAIRFTFSSTTNQVGVESITIQYAPVAATTYTVSIASENQDNILLDGDTNEFEEGATVQFIVEAPAHHTIGAVTVTKGQGGTVETTLSDGVYSFLMPADNVTISATFVADPTYSIAKVAENGTITVTNEADAYYGGEDVEFTVTANEGYEIANVTVTDAEDNAVELVYENGTGLFTMPASNVTITATFNEVQTGTEYTVYVLDVQGGTPNLYAWYGSDNVTKLNGDWPGTAMSTTEQLLDENTWFKAQFTAPELKVIVNNGNGVQTSDIAVEQATVYIKFDSSKAQGENAEVSYTAPERPTYTVTTVAENGTINIANDGNSFLAGDEIEFSLTANDGYEFSSLTVVDANNNEVEFAYDANENYGFFTMPSSNVTMTAAFTEIGTEYTVYVLDVQGGTPNLYAWYGSDNVTKLNGDWPGTAMSTTEQLADENTWYKAQFTAPELNVIVNNGTVQTSDIAVEQATVYIKFDSSKAQGENAEVSYTAPVAVKKYNIVVLESIVNGTVVSDKASAAIGETVTLTVTPDANYEVGTVKVTAGYEIQGDSGGGRAPMKAGIWYAQGNITVTKVDDTHYQFTLPEELPNFLTPNYTDNTEFRVNATFNSIYPEETLGNILDNGEDGVTYLVEDELTVVAVTENGEQVYCVGDDNRWVRVVANGKLELDNVIQGSTLSGVVGTLATRTTSPALVLSEAELETQEQDVSSLIADIDLRYDFEMPAPSQVVNVTGYYFDGDLRGWMTDPKGQSFTLANDFANEYSFTEGLRYKVKVGVELKEAWDTSSNAPHKVKAGDQDSFQNLKGQVVTSQSSGTTPTGIEGINISGKTVKSVRYYNITGVESSKPFQGVNIVVMQFTDGTSQTAKVIR